ncbi:hypothetical protein QYF36_010255 [Acer negundo]|nr:hypothetical protein QYF36_010255 [Acer negundo]
MPGVQPQFLSEFPYRRSFEEVIKGKTSQGTEVEDKVEIMHWRGSIYGPGKEEEDVSSARVAQKVGSLEIKKKIDVRLMGLTAWVGSAIRNPIHINHSPLGGKEMVDKGKSSWIKKAKVKAMVIYDKTAKIDLEKRRREVGRMESTKSFNSTSSESEF